MYMQIMLFDCVLSHWEWIITLQVRGLFRFGNKTKKVFPKLEEKRCRQFYRIANILIIKSNKMETHEWNWKKAENVRGRRENGHKTNNANKPRTRNIGNEIWRRIKNKANQNTREKIERNKEEKKKKKDNK